MTITQLLKFANSVIIENTDYDRGYKLISYNYYTFDYRLKKRTEKFADVYKRSVTIIDPCGKIVLQDYSLCDRTVDVDWSDLFD